jgi:hypothetical protein
MQRPSTILLLSLAAAAVLWLLSRTEKGQNTVAAVADAVGSAVRGIRNNNPGNIREGAADGTAWQGERATDDDTAFEEFTDMRYGVRAACKVFRNYQTKYGLRTVAQLIGRWAPPSENNTAAYVAAVSQRVGVNATQPLDLFDAELAYRFLRAVFRHECGLPAELIPEATIREGIALA